MKKLLFLVFLSFLNIDIIFAESSLPACEGENYTQFVDCYGSYKGKDFSKIHNQPGLTNDYIGEFGSTPGVEHGKGLSKIYVSGKYIGECSGNFINGLLNGEGICVYVDTTDLWTYVGEFKDDLFHGKGVLTLSDGSVYEGDFKDDLYHGKGVYTYPDGTIVEGQFKNGQLTDNF